MLEKVKLKYEYVDPVTGEVIEKEQECLTRLRVPFRSLTDQKQRLVGELYDPASSEVDTLGYEPLPRLIERCTVRNGKRTVINPGLLPQRNGTYDIQDVNKVQSLDDAFCQADPTDDPAFDLADSTAILNRAEDILRENAIKQSESATKAQVEQSETQAKVASSDGEQKVLEDGPKS